MTEWTWAASQAWRLFLANLDSLVELLPELHGTIGDLVDRLAEFGLASETLHRKDRLGKIFV